MEDQAQIVKLAIAVLGGAVLIALIGLGLIAWRYDGEVAQNIVGTFTQIAQVGLGSVAAVISAFVIAHRPTSASVAQAAIQAGGSVSLPPNGVVTLSPAPVATPASDASAPQTAEG